MPFIRDLEPWHSGRQGVVHVHLFVDEFVHLGRVRRETDASPVVDDADTHHSRLLRQFRDDVIETVTLIAQHVVGGISFDDVAHSCGVSEGRAFQMLSMKLNIQIAEHSEYDSHRGDQQQEQF